MPKLYNLLCSHTMQTFRQILVFWKNILFTVYSVFSFFMLCIGSKAVASEPLWAAGTIP